MHVRRVSAHRSFQMSLWRNGASLRHALYLVMLMAVSGCMSSQPTQSLFTIQPEEEPIYQAVLETEEVGDRLYFNSFDQKKLLLRCQIPASPSVVLLFIHGTAVQSRLYFPLADSVAKERLGIALMDLRGHGLSEGERGDSPSLYALVRDVRLALDTLKKRYPQAKLVIGGHSLGAGVCLNYISYFSERPSLYIPPSGLILMAGGMPLVSLQDCSPNDAEENEEPVEAPVRDPSKGFARLDPLGLLGYLPLGFLGIHPKPVFVLLPDHPLVTKAIERKLLVQDYSLQFLLSSFPIGLSNAYRLTTMPTLLLLGKDDELLNSCAAREALRRINTDTKELVLFSNTNHLSIIWNSGGEIRSWLKREIEGRREVR